MNAELNAKLSALTSALTGILTSLTAALTGDRQSLSWVDLAWHLAAIVSLLAFPDRQQQTRF